MVKVTPFKKAQICFRSSRAEVAKLFVCQLLPLLRNMFCALPLTSQTLNRNSILKGKKKIRGCCFRASVTRALTNTRARPSCWLTGNILLWKTAAQPEPQLKTLQPPHPSQKCTIPGEQSHLPGAPEVTDSIPLLPKARFFSHCHLNTTQVGKCPRLPLRSCAAA